MERFEQKDITRLLGLKRTALQQWIDRGYVEPSIERAQGPGSRNVWSTEDVLKICVFQELLHAGFSREEAAHLLSAGLFVLVSADNCDFSPRIGFLHGYILGEDTVAVRVEYHDGGVRSLFVARYYPTPLFDAVAQAVRDLRPNYPIAGAKIINVTQVLVRAMETMKKA